MSASTHVSLEDTSPGDPLLDRAAQVASLTGLRGFAALMVVLVHVSVRTDHPWVGLPGYGPVSLFVLSGFLLYRPWARWSLRLADRPSVPVFARRRVARIFPAYLAVLLLVTLAYLPARPEGLDGWFHAVTLTWIYVPGEFPNALAQTWSLATELSWYLALPVMGVVTGLAARSRSARAGFWIAAGMISLALPATVAWRWWVHDRELAATFTYSFWLPGFLVCFAGGALVALLAEGLKAGIVSAAWLRRLAADPWALLLLAATAALVATSTLGGQDGFVSRTFAQHQVRFAGATVVAITLLAIVVFSGLGSPFTRLVSTSWFTAVGRWSYGIYLWHLPLLTIVEPEIDFPGGPLGLLLRLALVLGLSIPLGAATYVWVEKPAIAWSHQPRTGRRGSHTGQRDERAARRPARADAAPAPTDSSSTHSQPIAAPGTDRSRSAPGE